MSSNRDSGSGSAPGSGPTAALGIHVAGPFMATALADASGRELLFASRPTPHGPGTAAESVWAGLAELVQKTLAEAPQTPLVGVGVAITQPYDNAQGTVSPLSIPEWNDFPLRARLHDLLPRVPVLIGSDAECEVIAEHWAGSAQGIPDLLGLMLGTDVGDVWILDNRFVGEHPGYRREPSPKPMSPEEATTLEEALGAARGPEIATDAWRHGWLTSRATEPMGVAGAADAARDAREGDQSAQAAFDDAGAVLGRAVGHTLARTDVDAVVLTGGIAHASDLLIPRMKRAMADVLGPRGEDVRILTSQLGEHAGAIGAAAMVLHPDRYHHPG